MDDEEFNRICIDGGGLRPLTTLTERTRWADNENRLARYHITTAQKLIQDPVAQHFVVHHGSFAMEHKANELLAHHGHRSKNHLCTQVALSRLLHQKDLASRLSKAYQDRMVYDYTADQKSLTSATGLPEFLENAEDFLAAVDERINRPPRHRSDP